MKAVALIGGLGSQMFKYAFYLALKSKVDEKCVIDTSFFLQRKSWNGYELKKIFGIDEPDMKDYLSQKQVESIKSNQSSYIDECLKTLSRDGKVTYYFMGSKYVYTRFPAPAYRKVRQKALFMFHRFGKHFSYTMDEACKPGNAYFDEYFHNSDEHFSDYKDEVRKAFVFPTFDDPKNIAIADAMNTQASVAIHVRRTDHLCDNGKLYESGYYKKCVELIKDKEVDDLTYYIFSDDLKWCASNLNEIGLSKKDEVIFVDWNTGENSYKDMQLMTYCKHNILAISSFSWWGYYLSDRNNKIVCAPKGYWTEVENHF